MKNFIFTLLLFFYIIIASIAQTSTNVALSKILIGHTEPVNCLAYSSDGNLLASGSETESLMSDSGKFEIIIWNTVKNKNIGHLLGHKDAIQSIVFNKKRTELISADSKGEIKIWDIEHLKEIKSIRGGEWISTICLTPDDRYIIGEYTYAKNVDLWDFQTGDVISTLDIGQQIGSMDISKDGAKIALSCYHQIQIWSLISGKQILSINDSLASGFAIRYSPDGKSLAVGLRNGGIHFFDPESLRSTFELQGHFKPVLSISFNNTGKYLVSGSSDQMIKVWSLPKKKEMKSLVNVHRGTVKAVAFSPTSDTFASSGVDKTIKLWKLQ